MDEKAARVMTLEVRDVRKTFAGQKVIDGISFKVQTGEFVAVLGPSGAGKTTLFRGLSGLLKMDSGQMFLNGSDVVKRTDIERSNIALVFQQFNLVHRISALQNVLAGRLGQVPVWRAWSRQFSREDQLFALDCLDRVGLLEHADQRADTLSGGQQQRVAIARALAQRPRLIIADEPVASLDPRIGAEVLAVLKAACATTNGRISVICSLHQPEFAKQYADRVLGLNAGRLIFDERTVALNTQTLDNIYASSKNIPEGAPSL